MAPAVHDAEASFADDRLDAILAVEHDADEAEGIRVDGSGHRLPSVAQGRAPEVDCSHMRRLAIALVLCARSKSGSAKLEGHWKGARAEGVAADVQAQAN